MSRENRPLIGINVDVIASPRKKHSMFRLGSGYCDSILAAGGIPLIIPSILKETDMDAILDKLDGFILSGGADMDPRRNNQSMHPTIQMMAARREDSDRSLVRKIIERKMPVLGIGLGMQQMNVAMGGSLMLHIPEEMPRCMPHMDPSDDFHRHLALLQPNTRLQEIYGGDELRVNSSHHQAVKTLGAGLKVGALAPDGIIEAIEHEDAGWFYIGVQWHPESESGTALDSQLFECFVQSCGAENSIKESLELAA